MASSVLLTPVNVFFSASCCSPLDLPAQKQVVSVDGEYSEIAETECGTSVFAAGSTIYQLSGVDLASRDLEAVDMTDDADCASSSGAPATAECYRCVVPCTFHVYRRRLLACFLFETAVHTILL